MACCPFQGMQAMQPQTKTSFIVSLSLVNLESLEAGQKESKVQEQGISFPCPLFDTIERVVNFYTLHFLAPLGILCCFV